MAKVLGVLIVLIVGIAIGYLVAVGPWRPAFAPTRSPWAIFTVITLVEGADGRCVATTADQHLEARRGNRMLWRIDDRCGMEPGARVQLRFPAGSPLEDQQPDGRVVINARVRGDADTGVYKYDVWMIGPGGEYPMEDPDIEIIQWF